MKLLLDESVDRDIAACFPDRFEIKTVTEMGWSGTDNGELPNDDTIAALEEPAHNLRQFDSTREVFADLVISVTF